MKKKQLCYWNNAKIHFKYLKYKNIMNKKNKLFLNFKNIVRLIQMYQFENCLKMNIEYHVLTIIEKKNFKKISKYQILIRQICSHVKFYQNLSFRKMSFWFVCTINVDLKSLKKMLLQIMNDKFIYWMYAKLLINCKFISCGNWLKHSIFNDQMKINLRKNYANVRKFCDNNIYCQLRFN